MSDNQEPTTAWMWPTNSGGVNGASIDTIDQKILWFNDAAACACGGSNTIQTFAEFHQKGDPLGTMPEDVREEMVQSLAKLKDNTLQYD